MECEVVDEANNQKKSRKPRKRMKAIYAKICDQMEFYFGDANLHKDRFMKKIIQENAEGYVSLEMFLKFNKIACLTDDVCVIADALTYKSTMLEVNSDRTHVRRTTPICEPKNVDERTVYVECIPYNANHDWIKKLFSACGKVTYVSLPRYPSSRDLKGFAFVEFETVEGALSACQELNNPPADMNLGKIGMFPKTSHQLDAIKKKLPDDQIKDTEEKVKALVSVCDPEADKEEADSEIKVVEKSAELCGKRQRTTSENSVECPTPTKRKKSDNQSAESGNPASDTEKSGGKKKSRKRKSRSKTTDSNLHDCDNVKSDNEADNKAVSDLPPQKKQKLDGDLVKSEADLKVELETSESKTGNDKENTRKKKKRMRNKREKEKKLKEIPELKVIPKTEWLKLREEYLLLQKTNMKMLKQTLQDNVQGIQQEKEDKKTRKDIEFVPNVIVKVTSEDVITRSKIKNSLKGDIQIAYIDVQDGLTEGHIRCESAESASQLIETQMSAVSFTLLTGADEKQYWDKLTSDRETKLNSKCRSKKRGHQKLMDKAQKASLDAPASKHIVFEDD